MSTIRFFAIGVWFVVGHWLSASELFKGTFTAEGKCPTPAGEIVLILEKEDGFDVGWLGIGDTHWARLYGNDGGVWNLLWSDGSQALVRLEREGENLNASWQTEGVETQECPFGLRRKSGGVDVVKAGIEGPYFSAMLVVVDAYEESENHRGLYKLFTALAQAFPREHSFAGEAAARAKLSEEKESAAVWYREAAGRAYWGKAQEELAGYHRDLMDLLNDYPEDALKQYQTAAALPAEKMRYLEAFRQKNARVTASYRSGSYREALQLAKEAKQFANEHFGPDHPSTLTANNNLAALYQSMGKYEEALPLYRQTLAERERVLGPHHPHTLGSRNNLAELFRSMGNYEEALPLYRRTLAESERVLGPYHPQTLGSRHNLAALYQSIGRYEEALPLLQQTLAERERVLSSQHADTLRSRLSLAGLYKSIGKYEEALPLYRQTLAESEHVLDAHHPHTLRGRNNFASLYQSMGKYEEALPLYWQTLAESERVLGPHHPRTLRSRNNLAITLAQAGNHQEALAHFNSCLRQANRFLERLAWGATDNLRHQILIRESSFRWFYLSLLVDYDEGEAAKEILHLALKRDGMLRRISIAAKQLTRASQNPALRELVEEFRAKQALFAALSHRTPAAADLATYKQRLAQLESDLDQLESQLALSIAVLRPEYRELDAGMIHQRLEPDTALVCFLAFHKFEFSKSSITYQDQQLIAVVTTSDGETDFLFRLGPLAPTVENIQTWRQAVTGRWNLIEIERIGRELYTQIWQPLAPHVAGKQRIYVVADGPLHYLPIEALPRPKGQPLGQDQDLVFMDAVHDLLEQPVFEPAGSPLLCYAPDFGGKPGPNPGQPLQTVGTARGSLHFTPLPGARAEGEGIAELLQKAGDQPRRFSGENASETALKEALEKEAPRLLHIASHGFLLRSLPDPDQKTKGAEWRTGSLRDHYTLAEFQPQAGPKHDPGSPLLRSGIALAGANREDGTGGGDDGLLTALEAESLNLSGTRLVVLSACETGLGEQREGEGVYGLRRAFFLAGARALLTTLWPVDDAVTRRFMERFYQLYLGGTPARLALRQVQREFRASENDSHPVFWAPFHLIEIPEP